MKRTNVWTDILLWTFLYFLWIMVFRQRAFVFTRTMTVEFCYLIFIAGNYYLNQLYNIPRFLYRQQYFRFIFYFFSGILCSAALRVPLAAYLNLHLFIPGKPQPAAGQLFVNSFVNIFIWVICLVAAKLIIDRIRFQQYMERIEKEKSKTELDFLKAQFNPHFLFNSINSIYSHIDKKNTSARNMLLTFSEMLRYQLYECNTETISIDKELNYIRNYVAIQQSRKEESLVVQLAVGDSVKGFSIAPLLFTAFIENCFKYVSDNDQWKNTVEISFSKPGDTLVFRTFNTKEETRHQEINNKGIGIANVKRRLELLYAGKYELAINEKENSHEVILQLELP